jgi:acyl-CoA reductase-like NAD-dependent aldehyde dehydrogenase
MIEQNLFIDGRWVDSRCSETFQVICPSTEEPIGSAVDASAEDVDLAVSAARRAYDEGSWPRMSVNERVTIIEKAAEILERSTNEQGRLVTSEMGQPISTATALAKRAVGTIDYLIGLARESAAPRIDEGPAAVVKEPVGVVAGIAPWNGPTGMAVSKIVSPLLAGCTVVFKPAPETPFDVRYLVEALDEAGLPAGALNLVTGGARTGTAMVSHEGVDKISFTGSTAVGRQIGSIAGGQLKRLQLELGGKSAAIILDDADLGVVTRGLAIGCFFNSGQVCAALTRVLAPRDKYDEVVEALKAGAATWVMGDPFDPTTTLGPLAGERHRERVEGYIASAEADGATVALGGGRGGFDRGWYVEPTVLVGVTNQMKVAREEIFGPVASVIAHDGEDDAVRMANDSDYGLHGAVFTTDPEKALDVSRRIRTGTFSINNFVYNNRAPFGGVKGSGIGRDTGREGFDSYFELKTINLAPGMESFLGLNPVAGVRPRSITNASTGG